MIDVSAKSTTLRSAVAQAVVKMPKQCLEHVRARRSIKGDPQEVARVAGIQAAKSTSQWIPFCHPLALDHVSIEFAVASDHVTVTARVKSVAKTGVEMEALTAAVAAALTLFDMLKPVDSDMEIVNIRVTGKKGGKSDFKDGVRRGLKSAVLVFSDTVSRGAGKDASGLMIAERLKKEGLKVTAYKIMADDPGPIELELKKLADRKKVDLILTTGGTGFGPRDLAPEATQAVLDRLYPGIPQAIRSYGQARTPFSMLSRGIAGLRGRTLIINLPGSVHAVKDALEAIFPGVLHSFGMMKGHGHKGISK